MSKINFYLKEPESKERTIIYLFFSYESKRMKYPTGLKILPKYWNPREQEVRMSHRDYNTFNEELKRVTDAVMQSYKSFNKKGIVPAVSILREDLRKRLQGEFTKEKTLFGFVEKYIEEVKATRKKSTIQVYNATVGLLKEYQEKRKRELDFSSITLDWYHDFVEFLYEEKGHSKNTVGKYIKTIKTFLSEADEQGISVPDAYKSKRFRVYNEPTEKVYLSQKELSKIIELDLSDKPELERSRDIFIFDCYTGFRYNDLKNVTKDDLVDEGTFIKIKTTKTGEIVQIPLRSEAKAVIERYNGLPKIPENQVMNRHLKKICQKARIDENVKVTKSVKGRDVTVTRKKWELITIHTARRSFATNAYYADVPTISLMAITGHKSEKAFLRYIRITPEENARKLLSHPFFKTASLKAV